MKSDDIVSKIEKMIFIIRNQKVMLDSDLAELYFVELKRLNEQVKRNIERFPNDFMFECDFEDLADLRSQIATANPTNYWNHKRRTMPMLFTENGIAMLSSVLNSKKAIQVNIAIMRFLTKLKYSNIQKIETEILTRVEKLEKNSTQIFKIIFQKLDDHEKLIVPKLSPNRKKNWIKIIF